MIRAMIFSLATAAAELPADKVAHFAVGATISAAGATLHPYQYAPEAGLVLATVAAIGKEIYDKQRPQSHTAEKADAAATVAGALLVYTALKTDRIKIERYNRTNVLIFKLY